MNSISKSDIDKIFGKILRDFRIKNGYTQEVMAERLGISIKYISRTSEIYSSNLRCIIEHTGIKKFKVL